MHTKLKNLLETAITNLQNTGTLPKHLLVAPNIEHTRNNEHGDYASNVAMLFAKECKMAPTKIADDLKVELEKLLSLSQNSELNKSIEKITVVKPGFINFYLAQDAFDQMVKNILELQEKYGHSDFAKGKFALVEFVSANPTGPLHVGHGRGAAFGDCVASLLEAIGYNVKREYYVNDAGRQMHVLALSVWLRYLELDRTLPNFPQSGYKGDYVIEIAKQLQQEYGEKFHRSLDLLYQDLPVDSQDGGDKEFYVDSLVKRAQDLLGSIDYEIIFQAGIKTILADIREDLEEFGVIFDEWFLESGLVNSLDVTRALEKIKQSNHVYEKDGALWFEATAYGDEKDRVLVRANGQTTYFASDVAYHFNKYERNFDLIIDIFGADHHGYAPRIYAFLKAMNLDIAKLKILLVQFAILYRGKEKVSMSTRGGEFVTLRELREEVSRDATRFFYIMRKNDQHLDFDLKLAKSQSADNPVYYIQYAHARICSVMRQLNEKGFNFDQNQGLNELKLLTNQHEENLLRRILRYQVILQTAAINYEPHLLAHYLRELANDFHAYYNASQFLVEVNELRNARLCLILATKQIIMNGLMLLGVSAPEAM